MANLKTQPHDGDVAAFLNEITDETRRRDSFTLLEMMREATGATPRLWGSSIIGFGDRHYRYASGHEGDTFVVGFASRKEAITVYSGGYLGEQHADILARLGKHKVGKGCLYIKRLQDVDLATLRELIEVFARPQ